MSLETQATPFPALLQWRQQGEIHSLLDHNIFAMTAGNPEAPTILFIHGFPTSSWDWHLIWPILLPHYHLVCFDMLGFGFSDKPDHRNYSIHLQADITEALITKLALDEFHIMAHDYGDTVAQELLARQNAGAGSGRWLSACFLNGGLFPETHRALLTQKLLLSPMGPLLNRLAGKTKFDRSFSKVFGQDSKPSTEALAEFWWLINLKSGRHIFHNLITYMNDRIQHRSRWVSALSAASVPLALINGSLDPVSGQHMVARYQQLECRLDYLAQLTAIGHYPQVEAPNEVAAHYLKFLSSI